jgi:hypothetical protein
MENEGSTNLITREEMDSNQVHILLGPKALAALAAISEPKKVSTFRAHPFKQPEKWISPHPNQYFQPILKK